MWLIVSNRPTDVIYPLTERPGSAESYDYVRGHNEAMNRIDFIEGREEITAPYDPGTLTTVQQHDGSPLHPWRQLRSGWLSKAPAIRSASQPTFQVIDRFAPPT